MASLGASCLSWPLFGPSYSHAREMAAVVAVLATLLLPGNGAAQDATALRLAQIDPIGGRPHDNASQTGDRQPATGKASPSVLVTFPLSTPDNVADEVGVQYRLQPITRYVSSLLGRRIVHYRVLDNQDVDRLVAALRSDRRTVNAQPNREYLALPNALLPPLAGGPPARTPEQASVDRRPPSAAAQLESGKTSRARKVPGVSTRQAMADADGVNNRAVQRNPSAVTSPRRSAALGSELRWPAADEPFVGPTAR